MAEQKVGIFRVAVAAVIVNSQNQVLLTKRSLEREHHPGEWEIMSGRLDQGEGFEEALAREAGEELSIKIEIICPLSTFHFFRGKEKIEHVGIAFLARHIGGEVVLDGVEEVEYAWISFQDAINRVHDESIKGNLALAERSIARISA